MFWAAVGKLANVMRNAVICVESFLTTFEAGMRLPSAKPRAVGESPAAGKKPEARPR